jgi:hypothetical protein
MHRQAFPPCQVEGDIQPSASFSHMGFEGAIPNKCASCQQLFEGECLRGWTLQAQYLNLDHGPCGVHGPTDPILYEDQFVDAKVEIPRKCSTCRYLEHDRIRGLVCREDRQIWGDFPRSLDWGAWQPDTVYLELPNPKRTNRALMELVQHDKFLEFVKESRRLNPGYSIQKAQDDFADLKSRLEAVKF